MGDPYNVESAVFGAESGQRDLIEITIRNDANALQRVFKLLEVGWKQFGFHGHGGFRIPQAPVVHINDLLYFGWNNRARGSS